MMYLIFSFGIQGLSCHIRIACRLLPVYISFIATHNCIFNNRVKKHLEVDDCIYDGVYGPYVRLLRALFCSLESSILIRYTTMIMPTNIGLTLKAVLEMVCWKVLE